MDKEYKKYNLHDRERIVQMRSSREAEQNIYNLTFFFPIDFIPYDLISSFRYTWR